MKITKSTIWAFVLLIVAGALYRVWPNRPFTFAPQVAMAIFGGAVVKDKRLALLLPLLSLLISDALYEVLYSIGRSPIKGYYQGQWATYLVLTGVTLFATLMKRVNVKNIIGFTLSGSVLFFIFSNFFVWLGHAGYQRPMTFNGLLQCYGDGLAFFRDYGILPGFYGNGLLGDLIFSFALFGSFYLINNYVIKPAPQSVQS